MISMVRSPGSEWYSPGTRIVLIPPPPVDQRLWLDRRLASSKSYADAVKAVGQETQTPVLDSWSEIWKRAGETEDGLSGFLYDGLHLNAAGYQVSAIFVLCNADRRGFFGVEFEPYFWRTFVIDRVRAAHRDGFEGVSRAPL